MSDIVRGLRLIVGAAILSFAAPALPQAVKKPVAAPSSKLPVKPSLVPSTAFTLECTGTYNSQQNFTWAPRFGKSVKDRRQTFVIDPVAMTVTTQYGFISDGQPWGNKPATYKISHITPAGRILYCARADNKPCVQSTNTTSTEGGTVFVNVGQTIIDMAGLDWRSSGMLAVHKGNSLYLDLYSTRGECKRV